VQKICRVSQEKRCHTIKRILFKGFPDAPRMIKPLSLEILKEKNTDPGRELLRRLCPGR